MMAMLEVALDKKGYLVDYENKMIGPVKKRVGTRGVDILSENDK